MDRFKVKPDGVELVTDVLDPAFAPGQVVRIDTVSNQGCRKLKIVIKVGKKECGRIYAIKNDLSKWMIDAIDANLPKILWGHNGRCIQTEEDYFMALTILHRLVGQNVTPATRERILPGMGLGNRGYIGMIEITVQMHDPGSRILLASHSAKYPKVRKPSGIYYGQSTKIDGDEQSLSIYDKGSEMKIPKGNSKGFPDSTTRIERRYRTGRRLAQAMEESTNVKAPYIATLSFPDAYALLRSEVDRLIGFTVGCGTPPPGKFNTQALILAAMWDDLPRRCQTIDYLMTKYRGAVSRGSKTARNIRNDLGALLAAKNNITLDQLIPSDPADFPWEDITRPLEEELHRNLLHQMLGEQITAPDPAIVEAFSETRRLQTISGEKCRLGPTDGSLHYARPWENIR